MKVLITGVAGFIGMHVALRMLSRGDHVVGVDNLNDYYDAKLKHSRLELISKEKNFCFQLLDIVDDGAIDTLFRIEKFDYVIHLAAQPGVRYSLKNPLAYIDANIRGFMSVILSCQRYDIKHFVYASSSSVYGHNKSFPFKEMDNVDHPVSLYAATKKTNELIAHTYSHLYGIPTTGLRFFTVYGPWGRPDMSPFLFVSAILKGERINIFNDGKMARDFTYIDDVVEGVVGVIDKAAAPDLSFDPLQPNPATSDAPFRIFNIGNCTPVPLLDYVREIEDALGICSKKNFMPMQPGDVKKTAADTTALKKWTGFQPKTPLAKGVRNFVDWYRGYYG